MSTFTDPLIVEHLDGKLWRIVESFEYHIGEFPSPNVISVESGFLTDFASCPRILWPIFPPTGKYGKAAIIHDWLYTKKSKSRKTADKIFLEAMQVLKVPRWKRYLMFWAVRAFGWTHWK